jgi:parallel beta-helix repeat protein
MSSKTIATLFVLGLVAGASLLTAGPLNPPAGPVASNYKTLAEVEPRIAINASNTPGDADSLFKITQRGSYYLTGNITGVANKHGIEIAASGVTLDLNGFDLIGVAGMGAFDGINVLSSSFSGISIRNGTVRNWGATGIDFSATVTRTSISGVTASGNLLGGIRGGYASAITECAAHGNTGVGMAASSGSVFRDCTAYLNTSDGIVAGSGSTLTNCASYNNGLLGYWALDGSTLINCTAFDNADSGFLVSSGATITNCAARDNGARGIISAEGSTVTQCTATANVNDGIYVLDDSIIIGNTCSSNGVGTPIAAGIRVTGNDNRIEGNHCTDNDIGYSIDLPGNIIIRNTEAGNTNGWVIVANNMYGPIIDRRASTTALVNGFSAPTSTLGSTDPNANFSY